MGFCNRSATRPSCSTRPRVGASSPPRGAAASTCPRRCAPAAPRVSPASSERSTPRRMLGPSRSSCQTPRIARRRRRPARAAASSPRSRPEARARERSRCARRCRRIERPRAERSRRPLRAKRRPRLPDARRGPARARGWPTFVPPASAAPGAASAAHSRNVAGIARRRRRVRDRGRSPGRPPPGTARDGARSAATAVSHSWFSRRSSQISSSPATGSSCEVGSSSSTSRGRGASAAASATRWSSPPESSWVERSSSVGDAQRQRGLLDRRARPTAGDRPRFSRRQGELGANRAHDHLGLGILKHRARQRADRRRPVLAGVQPADGDAPGEVPAMEMRHQAACGAQQRRLARRRQAPRARQNSPGLDG